MVDTSAIVTAPSRSKQFYFVVAPFAIEFGSPLSTGFDRSIVQRRKRVLVRQEGDGQSGEVTPQHLAGSFGIPPEFQLADPAPRVSRRRKRQADVGSRNGQPAINSSIGRLRKSEHRTADFGDRVRHYEGTPKLRAVGL